MSPRRRHPRSFPSRSAAILGAVRRTWHQRQHRLRKLHTAPANSNGSKVSSGQTNGHQGGISLGAHNTRQQDLFEKLPENANTPMLNSKLPHLKNLEIELKSGAGFPPSYDVFSLVSFLDASPALESFIVRVNQNDRAHYPEVGDKDECPRRKVDLWHNCLRHVTITDFCSAKTLIELTVHILESTHSLERLTLDTTRGYDRMIPGTICKCPTSRKVGQCWPMSKRAVEEAHRAVKTADRYITGRVPLSVQFEVLEPCSRCHSDDQRKSG